MIPTLRQSLLVGLGVTLLVALAPAGLWLDRTLARELADRSREDLALAPMRLEDRNAARGDALMMHAKELASVPGLARALAGGDRESAIRLLAQAPPPPGETPLLVGPEAESWLGPDPGAALTDATRQGQMPVDFVVVEGVLSAVSLAPVSQDGAWFGAAGVALPLNQDAVATLAGLTAADVTLIDDEGALLVSTLDAPAANALASASAGLATDGVVRSVAASGREWWVVATPLGDVAHALFALDVARELAVLPELRRGALAAGGIALLLAMVLGGLVAARLVRPVASLARAADRLAEGDFETPLPPPRPREVAQMTRAFEHMRQALGTRMAELQSSNLELARREERLRALQSEMIQRDRLTAAGRLVAELAHEIRNPVANVRNCLEVIRRRTEEQPELRRFADLAIDELLRMHELAEQMLELNRPIDPGANRCAPTEVVERVAALLRAGDAGTRWPTTVTGRATGVAPLSPDVLKQVLLNLAQNAREAMPAGGRVEIRLSERRERDELVLDVLDEGPGMADDVLPRVFDPFFTTKGDVRGVGLGLFIAEGLVRRGGGSLAAMNRSDRSGACFRITLPAAGAARRAAAGGDPPGESARSVGGTA